MSGNQATTRRDIHNDELVIDGVLATQPELGPSIPDGGYGWIIFLVTLFFQALVPSLVISFGMFLAFSRLPNMKENIIPNLWDDKMIYSPLFFISSWTFFEPATRCLISNSTWPRLVSTAGTCLTCAGLLFLWMGMAGYGGSPLFLLAGIISGIGASIQVSQCEILLAQYFRFKHAILAHITQAVTAFGFLLAPIIVGHHILNSNLLHVILWYQAIIIQGLVLSLTIKKPLYLKSKRTNYNYISTTADDEEDIFSKNSRELQIKRQNSSGSNITIEKHKIPNNSPINNEEAGPSQTTDHSNYEEFKKIRKNWESFEDEENEEEKGESNKYEILKEDWETFDEDDDIKQTKKSKTKEWETFDDNDQSKNVNQPKNLQLELSFAENISKRENASTSMSTGPIPIFSDLPVNNNNTYSYDVLEQQPSSGARPAVFMPTTTEGKFVISSLQVLQQLTFYKSLLLVVTTKFSIFVYYTLFPSYLYQELEGIKMRQISTMIGLLSLPNVLFSVVSYWVNIDKKRRPICLWFLCWVGCFGYFMISDSNTEKVLLLGAVQISLSIAALQYVGMPLLGLTLRGETNREYTLISIMSGSAFMFFLIINSSFKDCFRLMALLHFFTGGVWFSNYIYKKLK